MEFVVLFIFQLCLLFLLSRELTKSLSYCIFKLTRSKKIAIYVLVLLFFPGVVVHELAHFFMANILFVKTGEIEFFPKLIGQEVKLGSVGIAKTDPFRRFLIGAAPIIVGIMLIAGAFLFLELQPLDALWKQVLFGYVLFVIGNTMYSSRKDMEGAIELFVTLSIIALLSYLLGIQVPAFDINILFIQQVIRFMQRLSMFLLLPIAIDIVIISLTTLFLRGRL